MADFNDNNDALLLAALLVFSRDWADDPERWEFSVRPLFERVFRRRPELGPDVDMLFHELFQRPPRSNRSREQMREVALDVVQGYRRAADDELNTRLAAVEEHAALHASELHSFLWAVTCGVDLNKAKIVRYVPVRIYVGNPVPEVATLDEVGAAFGELAEALDLEEAEELPAREGSWFKSFFRKTKEALKDEDVKPTFDKAKAALEMRYLDKPQAETTGLLADAAAKLITALGAVPGPCCGQVGSLLIVKLAGADGKASMIFKTLTPMELRRLEENAAMLERPGDVLSWLAKACGPELSGNSHTAGIKEGTARSLDHAAEALVLTNDDDDLPKVLPGS